MFFAVGVHSNKQLTLIAASLYIFAAAELLSCFASKRSPVAAMVAAEESAGRGAGTRGALKSLIGNHFNVQ